MGKGLISDLIKKRSVKYKGGSFTEINNKDFDQLIVLQGGNNFKKIFALKGKGVILVKYWGCADNDSIIKNISKKINLISN
ncbi:hypothetical protein BD780_002728 [Clostridium tetanomorphum]|uniref:Uncharacterized protein n=2 Tax=Clostridium tetanomorphum TaxID=1553 RepID=A0A923E9N9_CLOTT|nr:hypothetical protein [Clostridium tetanomorphum]KAJ50582.1 hypothetical protein CTM_16597 [Clostridium tetanomorphum DSM 665]MBC2399043.1 hypothetical protein [Clostridium tetanomorphum]MBP1862656.1 hypothetical protein [Clostridium tetanomorphum]NRS85503.1 hypothetical protein [Clostridium tetanomorphum]NRZ98617.1 hypothetical protein [Clostridium tetanomorphum]